PTDPNVNRATAHRTIHPAPTNPAAPRYPHSSSILNASRFCTATAHSTPRPTDPPASSYFQTTIKIGNNFMQLLTNSAVEILLGDDRARASSASSSPDIAYIKLIVIAPETVEEKMPIDLHTPVSEAPQQSQRGKGRPSGPEASQEPSQ
ncbi:MAG: hypothetical protein Q9193_000327, partial [Seirophora villosa]